MSSILPTCSSLPSGYRSALALNNLSISMMETGDCELALKTIEESLPLMEDRASCGTAKLQLATNRYAQQLLEQQQQSSSCSSSLCEEDNSVHEIDDQDFASLREAAAATPKEGHQSYYPVRISAAIGSSLDEGDRIATYTSQYATLFYNCAIAHLLTVSMEKEGKKSLPTQKQRKSQSQVHLKKSMTYLQAAEDMLTSVMDEEDGGNTSAQRQDDTVVLLYALVFSLLRVVYLQLNLLTMASDAQSMLSFLCSKVDDDFEFLPVGSRDVCAAAA